MIWNSDLCISHSVFYYQKVWLANSPISINISAFFIFWYFFVFNMVSVLATNLEHQKYYIHYQDTLNFHQNLSRYTTAQWSIKTNYCIKKYIAIEQTICKYNAYFTFFIHSYTYNFSQTNGWRKYITFIQNSFQKFSFSVEFDKTIGFPIIPKWIKFINLQSFGQIEKTETNNTLLMWALG